MKRFILSTLVLLFTTGFAFAESFDSDLYLYCHNTGSDKYKYEVLSKQALIVNDLQLSKEQKKELERLAQGVLDVRDQHFDMTTGEMYNPESMPEDLKEVHHRLDLAVDRCYRPEPFSSDEERLECLFKLYAKMTKK